jgi:hypothetical protein
MTELVELIHPPTGKTIRMHPDLAAQKHRWLHPDPAVPPPAESLPLFDLEALDKVFARLAAQHTQHPSTLPALRREPEAILS